MAWNGSQRAGYSATNKASSTPQKKSPLRRTPTPNTYTYKHGILAGLLVAALGGAALWFFALSPDRRYPPSEASREAGAMRGAGRTIKEAPPAPAPRVANRAQVEEERKPKYPKKPSNWNDMTRAEKGVWMNANWPREKAPPSEVIADFRKKPSPDGRKPIFTNTLHQELNGYVVPGRDMPPPEFLSDEDAKKAFETIIEIEPDDSEEVQIRKQAVIDMLGEMADYMRDGGHANDYLQKIYQRQELEGEMVREVRKNVREFLESGDREGAAALLKKYNAYLEEKGIAPVRVRALEKE